MNKFCRNNTTFVYANLGKVKAFPQQVMKVERSDGMLGIHPYFDIRHNQDGRVVSFARRPHFTSKGTPWYSFLLSGSHGLWMRAERIDRLKIYKERAENRTYNLP